jgi:hypothetical protein
MTTLHLTLKKRWFDEILAGTKKIEYREIKPYWTKRLFEDDGRAKEFDVISFRNGYNKDCREMCVEFLGVRKGEEHYEISLGEIVEGERKN